jgi:hypothetical protein
MPPSHVSTTGITPRWPSMLDFRMASVDQKWTFTRYWLSILGRIPALFWRSANRVRTVAACDHGDHGHCAGKNRLTEAMSTFLSKCWCERHTNSKVAVSKTDP